MGTISRQQRVKWYLMDHCNEVIEPDNLWTVEQSFRQFQKEFYDRFYSQFGKNWDPSTFRWDNNDVIELIRNLSKYFPMWWNPDLFVWILKTDSPSWHIAFSCPDWFNVWFDADKYDYKICSEILVNIYYEKFNIWWHADRFHFDQHTAAGLEVNCQQFKEIWAPYYVEWKLLNE